MAFALSKVAVLLHLVLLVVYVVCVPADVFGAGVYLPLLLLAPSLLEMTLLFPPARRRETADEARARTGRALRRDPLLFIGAAGLLLLAVQVLNGPREIVFDAAAGQWRLATTRFPWLPFCMNRQEAAQGLWWFGTVWMALLAVRHGLSRKARARLLEALTVVAAALALLGLLQHAASATRLYWLWPVQGPFFATFGRPDHAGAFFAMMFLAGGGLLIDGRRQNVSRARLWRRALAMLLNLLGATFALADGPLLLAWAGAFAGLVYGLAVLLPALDGPERLRTLAAVVITAGALAFLHFVAYPDNAVHARVAGLLDGSRAADGRLEERAVLRRVAVRIWKSHPLFGAGIGGFRHQAGLHLDNDEWLLVSTDDPASCHNDYLQYLCELGLAGAGLLLAALGVLISPVALRLKPAFAPGREAAGISRRPFVQRLPPAAAGVLCALAGVALLAWFDLPFHSFPVLLVWSMLLALLPALLPAPRPAAAHSAGETTATSAGHEKQRRRRARPGFRRLFKRSAEDEE